MVKGSNLLNFKENYTLILTKIRSKEQLLLCEVELVPQILFTVMFDAMSTTYITHVKQRVHSIHSHFAQFVQNVGVMSR